LIDPTDVGMGHAIDQSQVESKGAESALNMEKGMQDQNEELIFQRVMTRKAREKAFWTSGETTLDKPDAQSQKAQGITQIDGLAGGYRRKDISGNSKKCSPEDKNHAMHFRSGVALVMEARDGDPPHDDTITGTRKSRGGFQAGYSDYTQKLSAHWNPGLYRFEAQANHDQERAVSTPPSRNPITHQHSREEANTPRVWTTHEVSNRNLAGKHAKLLTDFSRQEQDALQDRSNRIAKESKFAELCQASVVNQERASKEAEMIRAKNGHHVAHHSEALGIRQKNTVASLMRWE